MKTWTIKYNAPITIVVEAKTEQSAATKANKLSVKVAKEKVFIGEPIGGLWIDEQELVEKTINKIKN